MRLRIYDSADLNDTLSDTNIVFESTIDLADTMLSVVTIPAGGTVSSGAMIIEAFVPDGRPDGNTFFMGTNDDGQTGPSYIRAEDCGVATPTNIADIGFPDAHFVMSITGKVDLVVGTSYCASVPNSTGMPATFSGAGSNSAAQGDLVLTVDGVPNSFGIFCFGPKQIQAPFSNGGFMCVGGALQRIQPPVAAAKNMAARSVPASQLGFLSGDQINFQYVFRDRSAMPDFANTSDGYSVTFVD